jgi:hypothetical protein
LSVTTAPHGPLPRRVFTPAVPTISTGITPSFTSFKDQLITLLQIPVELTLREAGDLRILYKKYLAYLNAVSTMEEMVAAKTWPGKKPSLTDIVECFVSKTSWHDYYKATFPKLSSYPTMVKWLNGDDDAPPALEAWGVEKSVYVFRDLIEFVNNEGQLKESGVKKVKTKRKAEVVNVDDDVEVTKKVGKKVAKKVAGKKREVEKEEEESPRRNKRRRISQ